ncbi:MAG: Ger(x)C family spore germination protein [Clostridiales bacterium]|jgi:spore germination protein KC|nr:Ger(x)C family spore germination protein [Eubacteriales bacterium]MDH7566655.1 Ger(x)C family spore germination protein [Clostridiales bacterium]
MKRTAAFLLMLAATCTLLSGCYDGKEIDDQTYVIAIGLDKGETNKLRMTLQYAIPLAMGSSGVSGGGGGGGGEGESKSIGSMTLECPSVYSGLNMVNNSVGKQVNLSHAKVMVFSEDLAKDGRMVMLTRAITRGKEFRPNMVVAVSRGSAEDYLKSIKPRQEADPSKYYELKFSGYKYTGFIDQTQLHDFFIKEESTGAQAVAALVGVNTKNSTKEFSVGESSAPQKNRPVPFEGDYLAGNLPKVGDIKGEAMGLAVFNGPKMVGELDGEESTHYLMVTGKYGHAYVTFPDPIKKDFYIVVNLKQSRRPTYKIKLVDGKPNIKVEIKLEADYMSIQSGINYESEYNDIFERSAEKYLEEGIKRLLNRTSAEFHSDIFGFGNQYKSRFLTWDQWKNFQWLDRYKNSTFEVAVDVKVRRTGLTIRNAPIQGSEGEVQSP